MVRIDGGIVVGFGKARLNGLLGIKDGGPDFTGRRFNPKIAFQFKKLPNYSKCYSYRE